MRKKQITKTLSILTITTVLSSLTSIVLPLPVRAASCNWTGGSGDWETPGNWSCGSVPDADDDVTIDADVTVDINGSTTINSLTLGDASGAYSPTLNFDYDAIENGALTTNTDLTTYSGSSIRHTAASSNTIVGRISLVVSGSATISGSINTNGKGFQNTYGTAPGETDGFYAGGGGGHGGVGGKGSNGHDGNGGSYYGDQSAPITLGSGGGNGGCGAIGGDGGGTIKIEVSNTLSVNGTISSNGTNGNAMGGCSSSGGGGGAGGSIWIDAKTIAGSGTISANGGNGGTGSRTAGGGAGGRINLTYSDTYSYSGTPGISGGNLSAQYGSFIQIKEREGNDDINFPIDTNFAIDTYYFNEVTISSNVDVTAQGPALSSLIINADSDFTMDSGSVLNMNGKGYARESGTEPGENSWAAGGGGGHGGNGGTSSGSGGGTYGNALEPITYGSGGGSGSCNGYGGSGGGVIKFNIAGTLTLDGTISVNGNNGSPQGGCASRGGGGGAGGSIWLLVDSLTGSGNITAFGGDGGNAGNGYGGGGGGGRIAIKYATANNWTGNTLDPANAATAGTGGSGATNGSVSLNQATSGYITNLGAGLNSYLASDWLTDLENAANTQLARTEVGITDTSNNRIAEFIVYFDSDLDFSNISAEISGTKAYFHVPSGFSNIDGYDPAKPNYTLYIPKETGNVVGICPGVSSLNDIHENCSGLVYYSASDDNVEIVDISGTVYWKVSGLSSTGGFSLLDGLYDEMSRLQVNTASDHKIEFTTSNGIDANTDTITLEFDPSGQAFDLSSITVSDIDLEDDGADKTLAGSAGAGTWGVSINTSTDIITFTAPTDTAADEIADDSVITIKIGTNADGGSNQIVNPSSAGQYEIEMRMNTADSEYGIVEVAIVDDDTVNITSYIDSFILFDIDTSETDEDCDAAGGTSPCDSHSGTTDDSGYVVDLGEMSYLSVNASGDSVTHADGNAGNINYIYFDLSTNATGGATVTIISLNGSLDGSGTNTIPSVTNDGDGVTISAGDGAYGIREVSNSATAGSFTVAGDYDGGASIFGECTTSATQIFSTTSAPMDTGRLQMQVGASPDSSDSTGTYTDTLTFIVTSTF